jgi:MFS family permease
MRFRAISRKEIDMNTERTNIGWGFWIAWVLASIVGFGMGSLIGMSVSYALLPEMGITDEFGVAHLLMFGTMLGTTSGFLQWVVLREKVAQAGWWVLASAMGFAIAGGTLGSIGINENYLTAGILFAVLFGVAGGIMQALVLKRAQIARVGLWVLVNILGSVVGAISVPVAEAISAATGNYDLSAMVFGLLLGAGLGAIPGAVLVWLLRQSQTSDFQGMVTAR